LAECLLRLVESIGDCERAGIPVDQMIDDGNDKRSA
jgi:hypothetical protein